jgi:hypothetical protein
MAYTSWSVVFGEQPSAAKWNQLGSNDASFNDGTGLNTGAVQQQVSTLYSAVATGTTLLPIDDTIPQITEGDQYMTQAITPKASANILHIHATVFISTSVSGGNVTVALFQDSTANALCVSNQFQTTATGINQIPLTYTMTAGTTSSTTFRIRAGSSSANTITFNGTASARFFGTAPKSSISIVEYKG